MSQAACEISMSRHGDAVFMVLTGELDISGIETFHEKFSAAWKKSPRHIVIDLRDLTFIDSTGLRLVMEADSASRQDGFRLWIVRGHSPAVKNVLHVSGLDKVSPLVDQPPDLPA